MLELQGIVRSMDGHVDQSSGSARSTTSSVCALLQSHRCRFTTGYRNSLFWGTRVAGAVVQRDGTSLSGAVPPPTWRGDAEVALGGGGGGARVAGAPLQKFFIFLLFF
uniref:Uncharacterized protein n=1 Tax=Oryza sativa subsp. japonica TaxID=39947 RepID=Q6ZKV6_ORYSJ|nr:hypothetical protein [Oryza sativa Japonica Group]